MEVEPPGWSLDELAALEPDGHTPAELLSAVQATWQAMSMLHGQYLTLVRGYRDAKAARGDDDVEWAPDVAATRIKASIPRVRHDLHVADTLAANLPETFRQLRAGRLDPSRVRQITDATLGLGHAQCAAVEEAIYPQAVDRNPRQLRRLVKRAVLATHPDVAAKQHTAAREQRRVELEPADHGMAWLHAYLPAEHACAVYNQVDGQARHARNDGDPRTLEQLRADTLTDLVLGTTPTTRSGTTGGGTATTTVYATVNLSTLLGLDDLPGDLRGYGPLPAEQIRQLAYDLKARWAGVLVDDNGNPQTLTRTGYPFRGRLADLIHVRDDTCTFDGCNKPAERCDIDHRIPWPRGQTSLDNGDARCRRHHRLKTETQWTVQRDASNAAVWTSPDGTIIRTRPEPVAEPPPKPCSQPPTPGDDPPPF